jgi:hypothetical protein
MDAMYGCVITRGTVQSWRSGTMEDLTAVLTADGSDITEVTIQRIPDTTLAAIDPDLYARTAPAWDCTVDPGGPHYIAAGGGCQWCGMTDKQITAQRDPEHSWMKPSELGRYMCVTHPATGCLHAPATTIRSNGVWYKTAASWSSGHADCVLATIQDTP